MAPHEDAIVACVRPVCMLMSCRVVQRRSEYQHRLHRRPLNNHAPWVRYYIMHRYIYEFGRHGMSQLQPAALTPQPSAAEGLQPQVEEAASAAAPGQQGTAGQQPMLVADGQPLAASPASKAVNAVSVHASSAAARTVSAPEPSEFAAPEQQEQLVSPQQAERPPASSPPRSGSRQSSGSVPQGSTRQRIKDRLRRCAPAIALCTTCTEHAACRQQQPSEPLHRGGD